MPETMGPPSSLATKQPAPAPGQPSRASLLAQPTPPAEVKPDAPFVNPFKEPIAAPNPLAKPDIAKTIATDYSLDSPNYTKTNFNGYALKDYNPAAVKVFMGRYNKEFPNKPLESEFDAGRFLDNLEFKFGANGPAPAKGDLRGALEAGSKARLFDDPNRPIAEFANGLNLINLDEAPNSAPESPYAVGRQLNYGVKNQQIADNFSQLPPEQQTNVVLNMPYARKADTVNMLRESKDPNSIAIASKIQTLDESIYKQHAEVLGPVAIPGFMGGQSINLMDVLGNTLDSRTFEQRVKMLPPEYQAKVKALPPGLLSQLRYRADVLTGNQEASAAVGSADAFRQTGVGQSASSWQNLQENFGLGAVQPVGEAADTVNALANFGKPTNKILGNLGNVDQVINGGNFIAEKSDRINGYNQYITAAIASGDPARLKMIPQLRAERDKLMGNISTVSRGLTSGNDYELNGPSTMSQLITDAGKGSRLSAALAPIYGAMSLTPQWMLANMLGKGSVYGAEGGPGMGQYINRDNRDPYGDVLGATLAPGVGMMARGISKGSTNAAKGLANLLIPREAASLAPKVLPNAVKAAPKALTGAQQFAKEMAGKFNPPKPPLPGPSPNFVKSVGEGASNLASGMLNPVGYGISDLGYTAAYPAGVAYNNLSPKTKSNLNPMNAISNLTALLKAKGVDIPSTQDGAGTNTQANAAKAGLTSLQKALIAGGISVPAAIALSMSMGSKGSDELDEEEE